GATVGCGGWIGRMRIIAKRRLMALADRHGDCRGQIEEWYATAHRMAWKNLAEVRGTYRDTDVVGDRTVFNIKGNDYRLIVVIRYDTQIIYIKDLLTHAEYDKGKWKEG